MGKRGGGCTNKRMEREGVEGKEGILNSRRGCRDADKKMDWMHALLLCSAFATHHVPPTWYFIVASLSSSIAVVSCASCRDTKSLTSPTVTSLLLASS